MMAVINVAMAVEINTFDNSQCYIELQLPSGSVEPIWMTGSSTMQVLFAGASGLTGDHDGDGLDDVNSQMTAFNFACVSPTLGPMYIRLSTPLQTNGKMEEQVNNTPGTLDVPPFTATGLCGSFFDIFLEVTMSGQTFHNGAAKQLTSTITHEPPGAGEVYQNLSATPLLDAGGNPTGFLLKTTRYRPNPPTEVDVFNHSRCQLQLTTPESGVQTVQMTGNSTMRVFFEGLVLGSAQDDDNDGLDDVQTELTQWTFSGNNPALGLVQMHLSSNGPALGGMEEQANNTPGILDVPPFTATGTCDSFFDIFLEVCLPGQVLHSQTPIHLMETINHKPPVVGNIWDNHGTVQLYNESDNPTRYYVAAIAYEPNAPYCGDAEHLYPTGDLNLDCRVNFKDIAIVADHWLECTAPEPECD
ncbi:MAG: hypothetical protein NTW55_05225 [Planctomycetota bacterium]|nr:hypothetical protein [Planctomycetota bacterium]